MNIIVIKADGSFYTRPDTTLEREPKDFYIPDDIISATARTCTWIKVTKAGKAVPKAFAHRYFDALGRGILFTCNGSITHIDYSSYFFEQTTPAYRLDKTTYEHICAEIERVTRHISVRFADIIAFENDDPATYGRGDSVNPYSDSSLEFLIR